MHSSFKRRPPNNVNNLRLPGIPADKLPQRNETLLGHSEERKHRPSPPQQAKPVNDILLPSDVPVQPKGSATKAALERRFERDCLRRTILKFSPFDVFRECLSIFAKHPEKYGPLFKLLQDEHRRLMQAQLITDNRVMNVPGSLWGSLTGAHSEYQHEKDSQHQKQLILTELQRHKDEAKLQAERCATALQERDTLVAKTVEMQATLAEATMTSQTAEREMAKVKIEMDKVQGRNMQFQTVFDAYTDADEKQAQRHLELLRKVEDLTEINQVRAAEHTSLTAEHESCIQQREDFRKRENTLEQRIAELELIHQTLQAENRSLQEKVDGDPGFIANVSAPDHEDDRLVDSFFGKGTSSTVPKYLRWHGKVLNKKIRKAEIEKIISDVWMTKSRAVAEKGAISLADYFSAYLEERYEDPYQRMEFSYSVIYGAERYKADSDCELFLAVLRSEVPEEVYFDQLQMLADFKKCFEENDIEVNGTITQTLPVTVIKKTFHQVIPALSSWRYQALCKALKKTIPSGGLINYKALFLSDKDGDQTPLMEELRDGHLHAIQAYIADICEEVHREAVDECVTWRDIREAMNRLDPSIGEANLKKRLNVIAKASKYPSPDDANGTEKMLIAFADFKASFEKVFVKRVGQDPTGGDLRWAPRTTSTFDEMNYAPDVDIEGVTVRRGRSIQSSISTEDFSQQRKRSSQRQGLIRSRSRSDVSVSN